MGEKAVESGLCLMTTEPINQMQILLEDEQKMELNDHLSAQIEVKRRLSTYEEQWLECQEALELENN